LRRLLIALRPSDFRRFHEAACGAAAFALVAAVVDLNQSSGSHSGVLRGGCALAPTTYTAPKFAFGPSALQLIVFLLTYCAVLARLFAASSSLCFGWSRLFRGSGDCEQSRPAKPFS